MCRTEMLFMQGEVCGVIEAFKFHRECLAAAMILCPSWVLDRETYPLPSSVNTEPVNRTILRIHT